MIPLDYGNPGDRIPVLMDNGTIEVLIAGNVINSSEIQVHGEYVFSATSPRTETSDREIFQKKRRPKREIKSCQMVAASLWISDDLLEDIPPPYDRKIISPPFQSWYYIPSRGLCQATTNGSGVYDTYQECLANHSTATPNFTVATGIGSATPYVTEVGGELYEATSDAIYGGWEQNTFRVVYNVRALPGKGSTWYEANYVMPDGSSVIRTANIFDGSIVAEDIVTGQTTSLPGLSLQGSTWTGSTGTLSWSSFLNTPLLNFRATPPDPPVGGQLTSLVKTSNDNNLTGGTSVYRNTAPAFLSYDRTRSFYVKVHDPDLPPLKILEIPFYDAATRSYFIFLGTKAYFILKYGRVKTPQPRPWVNIKVIRVGVESSELVKTSETDFTYPNIDLPDEELVWGKETHSFEGNPITGDPCLDAQDFDLDYTSNHVYGDNYQVRPESYLAHIIPTVQNFFDD